MQANGIGRGLHARSNRSIALAQSLDPGIARLPLFVGEGEKDAVVDGYGAREKRRGAGSSQGDVLGSSADCRARRLFVR